MKRDFSDAAKNKLCGLIQEINDEQWCGLTDAIGDFFTWSVDIEDDWDRVEDYHKKILDKKDTTVDKIDKIFKAVETVDSSYLEIVKRCKETLLEQKEYIRELADCIGSRPSDFNASFVISRMQQHKSKLIASKVQYYVDKLKYGNGDSEYDYEYLNTIMETDPAKVPEELYAALILTFNNMNNKQKEKFIEASYIQNQFYPNPSSNDLVTGKYEFVISDVFCASVAAYADLLSGDGRSFDLSDPSAQSLIANYSLMRSIVEYGHEVSVFGTFVPIFNSWSAVNPVEVTIKTGYYDTDYTVEFNGSSSPYNDYGFLDYSELQINTYTMRGGDGIDYVFDEHAINLVESFRVDVGLEQFESVVGGVADIIIDYAGEAAGIPGFVFTAGSVLIDCVVADVEGTKTNNTVDAIQKLLADGNTYKALEVKASFGICNGKYQIYAFTVDEVRLDASIAQYTQETGKSTGFTAHDITSKIQNGTLQDTPGLTDFVAWYCNSSGHMQTDAGALQEN